MSAAGTSLPASFEDVEGVAHAGDEASGAKLHVHCSRMFTCPHDECSQACRILVQHVSHGIELALNASSPNKSQKAQPTHSTSQISGPRT